MANQNPMSEADRLEHARLRAERAALRGRADGSRPFDAHETGGATKIKQGSSIRKKF